MKRGLLLGFLFVSLAASAGPCDRAGEVVFYFSLRDPYTRIYFNGLGTRISGPYRRFRSQLDFCKLYEFEIAIESRYQSKVINVPARAGESYYFEY